jgi:hypothetical protein
MNKYIVLHRYTYPEINTLLNDLVMLGYKAATDYNDFDIRYITLPTRKILDPKSKRLEFITNYTIIIHNSNIMKDKTAMKLIEKNKPFQMYFKDIEYQSICNLSDYFSKLKYIPGEDFIFRNSATVDLSENSEWFLEIFSKDMYNDNIIRGSLLEYLI